MKSLLCAALASVFALALARADEGALRSLEGMARSARSDAAASSPAETAPAGDAAARDTALGDALRDALADLPAAKPAASRPAPPAPAPAAPRLWSRLYSTLIPSWRAVPVLRRTYDAPASTAAARGLAPLPALLPPPDSEAIKAGERRGLAELLSSSAAPADPR